MKPITLALATLLGLNLSVASAQESHTHAAVADGRAILELSPEERVMILGEMRLFLDGIQKMTAAMGRQDTQATAAAARAMGRKMVHEVPPALREKLPLEFRQLGFSVHRDFDQIAMDAESMKDVSTTLNQLSATLQKCVSCHTTYQIRTQTFDAGH